MTEQDPQTVDDDDEAVRGFAENVVDAAALAGSGFITFGAWLIFHPAGFIVLGMFLLAGAWLAAGRAED